MTHKKSGFIDIEPLMAEPDAAQKVARYFGASEEDLHIVGDELRTRCFVQCGKVCPTGNRVLAIQLSHAAKVWKCHNYGCQKSGNLVHLTSLGMGLPLRPVKDDFRTAALKLQSIILGTAADAEHVLTDSPSPQSSGATPAQTKQPPKVNVPLAESDNEHARGIVDLYKDLTTDLSAMTPPASSYRQRRPFLTDEMCTEFRTGYMPKGTAGSRKGGTMRDKWVYTLHNREGQIIGYAGRDCEWERKHTAWKAGGCEGDEPPKFRFPKNFHRSVELYGLHLLVPDQITDNIRQIGMPVVEGFNDVINLRNTMKVPAYGIMTNRMSDDQRAQIVEVANEHYDGVVSLFYDNDPEGNQGAAADAAELAKHCRVQRVWSLETHKQFANRQPESLTLAEGKELRRSMSRGRGA